VEEMSRVLQHPVRYEQISDSGAEKAVGRDLALMFRWFNEHGYDVDLWTSQERFRRLQISPTSFRAYLEKSHLGIGQAA
jgi:hypothetical protein